MRDETKLDYHERMLRVLLHIQNHLGEALPLDELAKIACFSPFHFHRLFRAMVGESVKEYVRRLRLERAAWRLASSRRSVVAIAFDAGYDTHESFTRAFRRMFGASPSDYRKRRRSEELPTVADMSAIPMWERNRFDNNVSRGEMMEVRLEQRQPIRVAFVRHVGPYKDCGKAWEKLCAFAAQQGACAAQQGWLGPDALPIGISHDDPDVTSPDKLRYDACLLVDDSFLGTGEIGVQEVVGGEYAVTTHRGPLSNLEQTYRRLFREWLPESKRELRSAPSFEVYRNDPGTTPPEHLVTDIYLPLAAS